jgi:nicotinamidase-related amidase
MAGEPAALLESVRDHPQSMGLEAWDAVRLTRELLDVMRAKRGLVVHTTMLAGPNSPHEFYSALRLAPASRVRGGPSRINPGGDEAIWDIVPELAPAADEIVLRKLAPSAFHGTPLSGLLRSFGVDTLLVTGNSTSGCVRATVVDAASELFHAIVVEECVYDRTQASHAVNLFDMDQKYADVLSLGEVVTWLDKGPPLIPYANEPGEGATRAGGSVREAR